MDAGAAGAASGGATAGTNGNVSIGTTNALTVSIGNAAGTVKLAGTARLGTSSALQTAAGNGETINTSGIGYAHYTTNGAARTGVILQAGTYDGQELTVFNEDPTAGNSITMAVVATSNVANGVTCVINGLQARKFAWNATAATAAWYEMK